MNAARVWMRTKVLAVLVGLTLAGSLAAQELRRAEPPPVPPLAPAEGSFATSRSGALFEAPVAGVGEPVLLPALKGIVLLQDPSESNLRRVVVGVDTASAPSAQQPGIREYLQRALGQPASLASLNRLASGVARLVREAGLPFVSVWIPPQDLTDGTVRIGVRPAVLDGPVQVVGAQHFSPGSYLAWVRQQPGQPVDVPRLQADIDWINRNPFRNAALAAEPGGAPGTTRLSLRVREQDPFRLFAGAENNGTRTTDKNRLFAGFNWGNAFGRGDQASYQLRADPRFEHSITHSASYLMDLPWRHALSLSGAWSRTEPDLGPVFTQKGTSWQLGMRYLWPAAGRVGGWEIDYNLGLDYKYADNNLEFAAIPVVGNETRIVQLAAGTSLRHNRGAQGDTTLAVSLMHSPGGAGSGNNDVAFNASRLGAPARYTYARFDAQNRQRVFSNWTWNVGLNLQIADVALLGSEQMAAGGASALRGYPESAVFGDRGAILINELHAPPWSLGDGGAQIFPYVFFDAASLATRGPGAASVQLASAGFGANMNWGRSVVVRAAIGWPLRNVPGRDFSSWAGHLRLQWSY